jgi:Cu(I)/Ag(I) efflux system membrane fusion protein
MKTLAIPFAAALIVSHLGACSNDHSGHGAGHPPPTAPSSSKPPAPAADPPGAVAAVDAVLAAYEPCRALLAADRTDGIAACAKAVADAARAGEPAAGEGARPLLAALVEAASGLGTAPAADIEAVRLAFGEVSRPVVALLAAVPSAGARYHVFECPMAKGFQRWVQPTAKLENPYMGRAMLECGSEVSQR